PAHLNDALRRELRLALQPDPALVEPPEEAALDVERPQAFEVHLQVVAHAFHVPGVDQREEIVPARLPALAAALEPEHFLEAIRDREPLLHEVELPSSEARGIEGELVGP